MVKTRKKRQGSRNKRSMAESDAMLQANLKKREDMPTVLRADEAVYIGEQVFQPEDLGEPIINIASEGNELVGRDWYQRVRMGSEVNDLIVVLKAGGIIPQKVTLSKRDGRYWIVDGQQRFWAHADTNTPMPADVYQCETIEQEKRLFEIMNTRRGVSANTMIGAKGGWLTDLLLTANDEHPDLRSTFNFGRHHARLFSASSMIRAIGVALGEISPNRSIPSVRLVNRLTAKGEESETFQKRSELFLDLAARVFVTNRKAVRDKLKSRPKPVKAAALLGMAALVRDHWSGEPFCLMPSEQQAQSLLTYANRVDAPTGRRYYVVYEEAMREAWPTKVKAA